MLHPSCKKDIIHYVTTFVYKQFTHFSLRRTKKPVFKKDINELESNINRISQDTTTPCSDEAHLHTNNTYTELRRKHLKRDFVRKSIEENLYFLNGLIYFNFFFGFVCFACCVMCTALFLFRIVLLSFVLMNFVVFVFIHFSFRLLRFASFCFVLLCFVLFLFVFFVFVLLPFCFIFFFMFCFALLDIVCFSLLVFFPTPSSFCPFMSCLQCNINRSKLKHWRTAY